MRAIQASEAKVHFRKLLDAVESGETFVITRYGRGIARLVPEGRRQQVEIDQAIEDIKRLRTRVATLTLAEFLSDRQNRHKY